jgi:hypothetical protein
MKVLLALIVGVGINALGYLLAVIALSSGSSNPTLDTSMYRWLVAIVIWLLMSFSGGLAVSAFLNRRTFFLGYLSSIISGVIIFGSLRVFLGVPRDFFWPFLGLLVTSLLGGAGASTRRIGRKPM